MLATYTIPMRAPSVNSLYLSTKKGKVLSKDGLKFKNFVKYYVQPFPEYDPSVYGLEIEVYFYLKNVFTKAKNKTISNTSTDLDNMLKSTIDSVFNVLKLNDSQVCKITSYKIDSPEDSIVFILKTYPLSLVTHRHTP